TQGGLTDAVKSCEIRFHNPLKQLTKNDIKMIFITALFLARQSFYVSAEPKAPYYVPYRHTI
ncbi:hypothetical protein, partial [Pseudomonas syringae]|uniref:hypothetical protein n=1 Tax=Pseudomonas syringae TaxID=317 RepID=UPI001E556ACD